MAKNARKRQNHTFAVVLYCKQFLRVRKPRLSVSALNLPHTCGYCGKSEFARRFYSKQYLKRGKIAFLPLFLSQTISARPKAASFGKRTQFAANLRLSRKE